MLEIAWNIIPLTFIINAKSETFFIFLCDRYTLRKQKQKISWGHYSFKWLLYALLRGKKKGKWDWERSVSRELNSGHPKHNSTICQCAAHRAISATKVYFLKRCHPIDRFCTNSSPWKCICSYLQALVWYFVSHDFLKHITNPVDQ